ncbi:hypothetical protein T265_07488 [Opisthorchis viverrini]|uniref:Uncharacterized protein n=1 Tax=Opisthorchis viverrini TaxID=6198 RepID=A0A074ZH22_OPIVI|nr:hypothetical protein T265_07488 [Opisthorchis viverrini]KER24982.1 hypothetical protein T265_07488 [Opisthorchis viverrini]
MTVHSLSGAKPWRSKDCYGRICRVWHRRVTGLKDSCLTRPLTIDQPGMRLCECREILSNIAQWIAEVRKPSHHGKSLSLRDDDSSKVRLLLRKLGPAEHDKYANYILPKNPRDINLDETTERRVAMCTLKHSTLRSKQENKLLSLSHWTRLALYQKKLPKTHCN